MKLERVTPRWIRRLIKHHGHRCLFLWLFASVYACLGLTLVLMEQVYVRELFHTHWPPPVRSLLWFIAAGLAIATAKDGHEEPKKSKQWIGFLALVIPPAQRFASYFIAAIWEAVTLDPLVWPRLFSAFTYVLWIAAIFLVSTWPDEVHWDEVPEPITPVELMEAIPPEDPEGGA
jgi:hypothetical protein